MQTDDTVTDWLRMLGDGDELAAHRLWGRFSDRMGRLARRRLKDMHTAGFDEEDVALSAFHEFCRAVQDGRYSRIADRNDLWRLLAVITRRKAAQRLTAELRQKRGGEVVQHLNGDLNKIPDSEPTPELIAMLTDECRHFLGKLADDELRLKRFLSP